MRIEGLYLSPYVAEGTVHCCRTLQEFISLIFLPRQVHIFWYILYVSSRRCMLDVYSCENAKDAKDAKGHFAAVVITSCNSVILWDSSQKWKPPTCLSHRTNTFPSTGCTCAVQPLQNSVPQCAWQVPQCCCCQSSILCRRLGFAQRSRNESCFHGKIRSAANVRTVRSSKNIKTRGLNLSLLRILTALPTSPMSSAPAEQHHDTQ